MDAFRPIGRQIIAIIIGLSAAGLICRPASAQEPPPAIERVDPIAVDDVSILERPTDVPLPRQLSNVPDDIGYSCWNPKYPSMRSFRMVRSHRYIAFGTTQQTTWTTRSGLTWA